MSNQTKSSHNAFLCAALITLLAGCTPDKENTPAAQGGHGHHGHMQMSTTDPISGQSIYQLNSEWTDQSATTFRLAAFAGKPLVLAMVYTHCEYACPRIIADMRMIRDELEARAGEIRFVLVSIDPARDTVERLQTFGEETGLTRQGWMLLRSDESSIRELAAVFGVQYRRTTETDFAHSNIINVLNSEGEIVHQQEGLGGRPDATVAAIRKLF